MIDNLTIFSLINSLIICKFKKKRHINDKKMHSLTYVLIKNNSKLLKTILCQA